MANKQFHVEASVSTDNPGAVLPVLEQVIGRFGSFEKAGKGEFLLRADVPGTSAKDLNRSLLSALRKAEKRTRLRAQWSSGNTTEHYFDYVLKKKTTSGRVP